MQSRSDIFLSPCSAEVLCFAAHMLSLILPVQVWSAAEADIVQSILATTAIHKCFINLFIRSTATVYPAIQPQSPGTRRVWRPAPRVRQSLSHFLVTRSTLTTMTVSTVPGDGFDHQFKLAHLSCQNSGAFRRGTDSRARTRCAEKFGFHRTGSREYRSLDPTVTR